MIYILIERFNKFTQHTFSVSFLIIISTRISPFSRADSNKSKKKAKNKLLFNIKKLLKYSNQGKKES